MKSNGVYLSKSKWKTNAIYYWGQWSDKLIVPAAERDLLCVMLVFWQLLHIEEGRSALKGGGFFRRCYEEKELVWWRSSSRTMKQGISCVCYPQSGATAFQRSAWYLAGLEGTVSRERSDGIGTKIKIKLSFFLFHAKPGIWGSK